VKPHYWPSAAVKVGGHRLQWAILQLVVAKLETGRDIRLQIASSI
jgi:hypothetical protein